MCNPSVARHLAAKFGGTVGVSEVVGVGEHMYKSFWGLSYWREARMRETGNRSLDCLRSKVITSHSED